MISSQSLDRSKFNSRSTSKISRRSASRSVKQSKKLTNLMLQTKLRQFIIEKFGKENVHKSKDDTLKSPKKGKDEKKTVKKPESSKKPKKSVSKR